MINTNQIARIALIALLITGCFFVLQPFMAAVLFAAVFCVFTWPAYHWLWLKLGRRDNISAVTMTLILSVAIILPMAYLATNLAESAAILLDEAQVTLKNLQPQAPEWLTSLPLVGQQLGESWQRAVVSHEELMKLLSQYAEPLRKFMLQAVQMLMGGFLQMLLVAFVAFFFYRDGRLIARSVVLIVRRPSSALHSELSRPSITAAKCSSWRA